jgi:preprotein translocase subunit YajC
MVRFACAGAWVLCLRRVVCVLPIRCGVSFVFISSAFAQTAPAAAAGGGDIMSSLTGMLPLVLMFVVLYFVMIRPQMKRQKEHRAMIDAIAKGDEVATAGGIIGKVTRLSEGFLHIEIASGVEVQVQRSAVAQVLPKGTVK